MKMRKACYRWSRLSTGESARSSTRGGANQSAVKMDPGTEASAARSRRWRPGPPRPGAHARRLLAAAPPGLMGDRVIGGCELSRHPECAGRLSPRRVTDNSRRAPAPGWDAGQRRRSPPRIGDRVATQSLAAPKARRRHEVDPSGKINSVGWETWLSATEGWIGVGIRTILALQGGCLAARGAPPDRRRRARGETRLARGSGNWAVDSKIEPNRPGRAVESGFLDAPSATAGYAHVHSSRAGRVRGV